MIKTKEDLQRYLQSDLDRYFNKQAATAPGFRDFILRNEVWYIWSYIKCLRKLEYYLNNAKPGFVYKIIRNYYILKIKRLQIKTGLGVGVNSCDEGLCIYHLGTILISDHAKIGKRFVIRPGCVVGNTEDGRAPHIDDDVEFSLGVKVFGNIHIGRGALINANSVVVTNVPPYAIVMGNPGKVVEFRMTPKEIIEYEKIHYAECERLSLEVLEKNYEKYYLKRIKKIVEFIK